MADMEDVEDLERDGAWDSETLVAEFRERLPEQGPTGGAS